MRCARAALTPSTFIRSSTEALPTSRAEREAWVLSDDDIRAVDDWTA